MFVYVCCEARPEAPVPKSHENALLRQRQFLNKVNFLLICVSEKHHFCVRMFRRYVSYEKWVQYVFWWWWGERIGHNLWSCSFLLWEWMDSRLLLVSERGGDVAKSHVTLIKEMNRQWRCLTFSHQLSLSKFSKINPTTISNSPINTSYFVCLIQIKKHMVRLSS